MKVIKVMVVEDDAVAASIVKNMLEKLGYLVPLTVSSGEAALLKTVEIMPDIILMDIMLEGEMDGIEASEHIHRDYDIPVIYLTAHIDDEILERAKITEPFGYIVKPFSDKELHSTIKMALYKYETEKKMKEKEELFYTTLNSVCDGVITIDNYGNITFMNPVSEKLTGWSYKEAEGRKLDEVFCVVEEKNQDIPGASHEKRDNGTMIPGMPVNTRLITKDNVEVPILINKAPINDRHGNIMGVVFTFHDISDIKQAQNALMDSYFELIETISHAFAYRDPYTAVHQRRVAELAKQIGYRVGLSGKAIDELYIGGLLHDIGKLTVPIEILSKPSRLSSIELELIKEHPARGYEIFEDVKLPWSVSEMILHHHEKLDGSGYPHGIYGEMISRKVRIITVCDVVESMSTLRPYRSAHSKADVIKELEINVDTKYDREIVEIMIDIINSGVFDPWGK